MLELSCFFILLLFLFCYFYTKSFFHPSVIICSVWGGLLLAYSFFDHPLYDLSNRFFYVLWLWILPFCLCSLAFSRRVIKISCKIKSNDFNAEVFKKLYPYVIGFSLCFIFLFIFYSRGEIAAIRELLLEEELPPLLKLGFYLSSFFSIYTFYAILNYKYLSKKKIVLLLVLILIISLLKSNKTSFIALFCGILYCLYKNGKLRIKYLLISILVLLGLVSLVSIGRADYNFESDSGVLNFVYIYTLSPLTAFDSLINNEITISEGTIGSSTFTFLYKILAIFGIPLKFSDLGTWVYVPLPTNVFTTLRGFYMDFGCWGVTLISAFLGSIWGVLYKFQEKNYGIFVMFYASMVFSLFIQFFGDYFFYTMSVTIQYLFFSFLLQSKFKVKKKLHQNKK